MAMDRTPHESAELARGFVLVGRNVNRVVKAMAPVSEAERQMARRIASAVRTLACQLEKVAEVIDNKVAASKRGTTN